MKTRQILALMIGIRELLSKPKAWTKGSYAKGKNGLAIGYSNSEASCFCLVGACNRVTGENINGENELARQLGSYLGRKTGWANVVEWNDIPHRTHAEVLAFLDTSISVLKMQVSQA